MQSPGELLNLTSEPAVLLRAGRVAAANPPALELLGADCLGKNASALFGPALGHLSAATLAQLELRGKPCVARVVCAEKDRLVFLRRLEAVPNLLNQPFLYSLRNALMNMELAADRLREQADDYAAEPILESLRSITRSQFRLHRLLQNASLIMAAAEDEPARTLRRFSLRSLCGSVLDALQPLAPQIRFTFHADGPAILLADPDQIKILLMNLLSNVLIHARGCTDASLSLLTSGQHVVLALDDNGCGIPAQELYKVFDRYRHSFDLSQMAAGPGLGLTAVRIIAQLHGGTLLLESREGRGTTLRVSLERCADSSAALEAAENPATCDSRDLLVGLADCLPLDCFSERYLD